MTEKYKILTISDHPLVSSGVGIQTRHIIEGLLKTGKYQIASLGGAIKHKDYRPQKVEEYADDWVIFPINGYGDENVVREIIDIEKPDALWIMTDPRFYIWLFNMSDEIRDRNIPLLYYHVWDEFPLPKYNKGYYDSCDYVGCISQLTYKILAGLGHKSHGYIPHAVEPEVYKPLESKIIKEEKEKIFGPNCDKFVFFYNSRNARRKMTSDVIRFFKELLLKVGEDKAALLMHTDPKDNEGANLIEVAQMLDIKPQQLVFSTERIPPEQMNVFYNVADTTLCLSNNEGFGLSSLESLMAGTPVISVKTGGLQDQNIDHKTAEEYGVSLVPKTKSLTGSQQIPYIFDCRCTDEDVLDAYLKMFNMPADERKALGLRGRKYVSEKFTIENMVGSWDAALEKTIKEFKENGYKDRVRFTQV